jgi:hypothetical protein
MRIVIRSVNYADMLAVTLPQWVRMFPQAVITIATSPQDHETQRVAGENGAHVHATDAWFALGPKKLDGGTAADEAFGFVAYQAQPLRFLQPPEPGEVCISADCDVYPMGKFPAELEHGTLYGCGQYLCLDEEAFEDARTTGRRLALILPRKGGESELLYAPTSNEVRAAARRCIGYTIAWRHQEGRRLGSSKTAGGFDIPFGRKFERHVGLTKFYVLHLGQRSRANWTGRVLPKWGA